MKLVLLSGGRERSNQFLHQAMSELVTKRRSMSFTYIPFCFQGSEVFFKRAIRRYRSYGFTDFYCMPIDCPIAPAAIKKTLKSSVIYLAGGNTFYFLYHLRKNQLLEKLKTYISGGGVLAGLSAGAIMLTPNINLAGYPSWNCDANSIGIKNLSALNLTNFEFFPHFDRTQKLHKALLKYSLTSRLPIFACKDGGGIVIDGPQKSFLGEVWFYHRGYAYKI